MSYFPCKLNKKHLNFHKPDINVGDKGKFSQYNKEEEKPRKKYWEEPKTWEAKKNTTRKIGGGHPENRLQQMRVKSGITQEQAAEHFGFDVRTLQRYESGEKFPDMKCLVKMTKLYQCTAGELFS